jgi:uncharacterized protein YbjT (DUF2867 family)
MGLEEELRVAKLVIDAAQQSSEHIRLFVYSSLEPIGLIMKSSCPHFDGKAEIAEYLRSKTFPSAFVKYGFYYSNFLTPYGSPKLEEISEEAKRSGQIPEIVFKFPITSKFALVPVYDAGRVVVQFYLYPSEYSGKEIGLCGDLLNGIEIAQTFSKVTGRQARFEQSNIELLPEGSQTMWKFKEQYASTLYESYLEESKRLCPDIQSLEQWLQANLNFFDGILNS